ncbi:MAG: group II intron reverse transcriptase/maturase [bacterium]
MIKTPISLQELRRKIYIKAKAEKSWRFWGIYVHVCKIETLQQSYLIAKRNKGAPGIDGVTFEAIEEDGVDKFLEGIQGELISKTYYPMRNRKVEVPKGKGKYRTLGIPAIRDRVVQGALKLILEPIFESDFQAGSYGYRPKKTAHEALEKVRDAAIRGKARVIDVDLKSYFDTVRHDILLSKISVRVNDANVMRLLKLMLKTSGKRGIIQGGPLSPFLSNIYLNEVDMMLERAKEATSGDGYQHIEYARWADDLIILVDEHRKWDWLERGVKKRLMEELSKIDVAINLEKTKLVDLNKGGSFCFLGFKFIRNVTKSGKRSVDQIPKIESRTKLLRKLKVIFRQYRSQSMDDLINQINPILRGWVNYFRVGNSSRSLEYVRNWVDRKIRRQLMRAKKQKGFGWCRRSINLRYQSLDLYADYSVRYCEGWKARSAR